MRLIKYLLVLWVFTAVYAGMSVVAGPRGIFAYSEMLEEQEKQEKNMETLRRINAELGNRQKALLYDSDTIRIYARNLGLGGVDEKFVRIVGLGQVKKAPLLPGEVVAAEESRSIDNKTIHLVALFAALAVFAALLIQDILDLNLPSSGPRNYR
ncbi:MAG: septum formation initiator family protein [Treponema sp.]|jgi:cell division protein FtsB|nr:septum formation initiator family protein [Treponema sp.]